MFLFILSQAIAKPVQVPGFPAIPEDLLQLNTTVQPNHEICQAITLPSAGYNLIGVLHFPKTPQPSQGFPVVVIFHGFRGSKLGGIEKTYRRLALQLAIHGIATLRIDMAGCGDSEGQTEDIAMATYLQNSVDILQAIHRYPELNPHRIGIAGFSFGCHLALNLTRLYMPKILTIKSLSLWAAIADGGILLKELYSNFSQTTDLVGTIGQEFGFTGLPLVICPGDIESFLKIQDHIVVNSLPLKPPILHQHGKNDFIVSLIHQALFENNSPGNITFITYENTGHSVGSSPHRDKIIQEIVRHFMNTL
ncbi:alpha/beta hydrolase [Candidatus Chlamydia sanziniae]|uniref:alpha/beta hydrolase n=1 Tax=Candidatus Chlamydia sanziniae TaxID=1806891 RepID=UPI001E5DC8CA|nr:alpha/beta hydrolase [Candidatus Chlamydia sanziniae]